MADLIRADALDLLDHVEPGSVQACVTSPPYLRQRRYGDDPREGGRQETLAEYVQWLADVLDGVRTALHPSGLLWLNIGDKANGSGGAGGDWTGARKRKTEGGGPGKFTDPAYAEKGYLDVPGAVVAELLRRGWRLRLPIVWDKGRQAPEDLAHVGRPRPQHEMLYLLAPGPHRPRFYPSMLTETGSVWHFPPGSDSDQPHLAPFPDELARRCILPSTLPGDLVLDPFAGSGTTLRVAEAHGRRAVGLDLYAGEVREPLTSGCSGFPTTNEAPTPQGMAAAGFPSTAAYYFAGRLLAEGRPWAEVAATVGTKRSPLPDSALEYLQRTSRRAS